MRPLIASVPTTPPRNRQASMEIPFVTLESGPLLQYITYLLTRMTLAVKYRKSTTWLGLRLVKPYNPPLITIKRLLIYQFARVEKLSFAWLDLIRPLKNLCHCNRRIRTKLLIRSNRISATLVKNQT